MIKLENTEVAVQKYSEDSSSINSLLRTRLQNLLLVSWEIPEIVPSWLWF